MQDTCISYIKKYFHAHCDVISDEYSNRLSRESGRRAIQFQFAEIMFKLATFSKEQCHSTIQ